METIRVGGVKWSIGVRSGAGPLDWLRGTISKIKDGLATRSWRSAKTWVANQHAESRRESNNLVGGGLEADKMVNLCPDRIKV
jgi:hypothetical protein